MLKCVIIENKIEACKEATKNFDFGLEKRRAEEVDRAYTEACRKGTKQVFNARIILAGYSGGGKTSLANRLLGEQINVDERNSTEGIALHRIESTFNRKEMTGEQWDKKELNSKDLKKDFNHGIVAILQKGKRKISIDSADTEGEPEHQETIKHDSEHEDEDTKAPKYQGISNLNENEEFPSLPDQTKEEIMALATEQTKEESEESTPFSISLWDLGGQDEFISTHHLFLDSKATIFIVMDITKSLHQLIGWNFELGYLNSPAEVLHYWLDLFHTDAAKHNIDPNIAIVLTHKDKIKGDQKEYIDDYVKAIMKMVEGKPYAKYISKDKIFTVSNVTDTESDFEKLRDQLLRHLVKQEIWGFKMPVRWLKLKVEIIERSNTKNKKYLPIEEVWELGDTLLMGPEEIESFLQKQTTLGDFIYFPDLRDLVITDPKWVVDKCKALITAREFINQRTELPESIRDSLKKGEITESGLRQLWENHGVVFLIRLMEKFDLIVDVSDESGRKYIIPSMLGSTVQQDIPHKALIGSFPQLISKCSKEKNWKLRRSDLSYTTATFDIGGKAKLSLSLSLPVHVQTKFEWPEEMHRYDKEKIQRESKEALVRILRTCRIQTSEDAEGNELNRYFLYSFSD